MLTDTEGMEELELHHESEEVQSKSSEEGFSLAASGEARELATSQVTEAESSSVFPPLGAGVLSASTTLSSVARTPGSRDTTPGHVRGWRNPRQEAELIQARTKIVQLETDILTLRRAAKRARIEEEEREDSLSTAQQRDRVYKVTNLILYVLIQN